MKEDQLKHILLFFFFVTLSDKRSKILAQDAWFWCLDEKKRSPHLEPNKIILLSIARSWKKIEKEVRSGVASFSADSGWLFSRSVQFEPWKEFQKTASSEELFITVLAQILKFPEELLTNVLGLSSGTIRYRLAKTTRTIGAAVEIRQSGTT